MRPLPLAAVAVLLAGCAAPADPALNEEFSRPLTCAAGPDCAAKWDAAQLWIVNNAGWKLQTATSVVLQTFGPSTLAHDSTSLAVTVTREPDGPGRYRLWIKASCGNPFGCTPEVVPSVINFKRSVGAAVAP